MVPDEACPHAVFENNIMNVAATRGQSAWIPTYRSSAVCDSDRRASIVQPDVHDATSGYSLLCTVSGSPRVGLNDSSCICTQLHS